MGTLHHITPSGAAIVEACIRAADPEDRASRATSWASEGSALHQLVEDAAAHGWDAALSSVPPEHLERAAGFDLAGLERALHAPLAAFSWGVGVLYRPDIGEGVLLGMGLSRQRAHELAAERVKALEGCWIVGLLDLAGVGEVNGQTWVLVPDLKTGHQRPAPAASCTQTIIYALALAAAVGAKGARHGPLWAPEDLRPRWDKQDLDATGMFEAEQRVAALFQAVEDSITLPPEKRQIPVYGDHCRYCRQAHRCQAPASALARLSDKDLRGEDGRILIMKDNFGALYERACAGEALLKSFWEAADALAGAEPGGIPLPDGRVYGRHEHHERKVNPGLLYKGLLAAGLTPEKASELMQQAVESKVSVGKLEGLYINATLPDPKERRGKVEGAKLALTKSCQEVGAIYIKTTERVGPHHPKKETT